VTVCTDFTKLHDALAEVEAYELDENELEKFIQALYENTFELDQNYVWLGPYDWNHEGYRNGIIRLADEYYRAYDSYRTPSHPAPDA